MLRFLQKRTGLLVTAVMFASILTSCGDDTTTKSLDGQLYDESTADGLIYYRNGEVLAGQSPSPHGAFKLAFNDIAQAALDTSGELPVGAVFPEGSLIVKEIQTNGTLSLLAVMKKESGNDNAAEGWLWSEYDPDGSVVIGVSKKGTSCTGCHGGSPNRDLTRTFDLH